MTSNVFDRVDEVAKPIVPTDYTKLIEDLKAEGPMPPPEPEEGEETQETAEEAKVSPEAKEEPEEAKTDETKEEPVVSKREKFREETKREREYRAREEAIKSKEQAVNDFDQILSIAKDDPEKLLAATGWDVDKFLEWQLLKLSSQENLSPEEKQKALVREEVRKAQEEERTKLDTIERERSEKENSIIKNRVAKFVEDNSNDYPLIFGEEMQETVFEVYKQTLEEDPTQRGIFTIKDAAQKVESHFVNDLKVKYDRYLKTKSSEEVKSEDEVKDKTPKEPATTKTNKPKTLTNRVGMQSTDFESAPQTRSLTHNDPGYINQLIREYEATKTKR